MNTRPERIAELRDKLDELDRALGDMRIALANSNAEDHQRLLSPVLDRLSRILQAERRGYTQYLADELVNIRSGIRRLPMSDRDPILGEPTPALQGLRGARGNLVESLDNVLEAAAELRMHPHDTSVPLPLFDRQFIAEGLIRLDERLRRIEEDLGEFTHAASGSLASPSGGLLSEPAIVDTYARKIGIQVDAARFETRIAERVDIPALSRAIGAMQELAHDLGTLLKTIGSKLTESVQFAGNLVVKSVSRGYKGFRVVLRRAIDWLVKSAPESSPQPNAAAATQAANQAEDRQTVAKSVVAALPYLRRYARALTGSQMAGDAYVATTLETLVNEPDTIGQGTNVKVDLFRVFTRIWNADARTRSERVQSDLLPAEARLQEITPLPRQAFLLFCLEDFSEEETAEVLSVEIPIVRDLVEKAGLDLAVDMATDILIIEDEPLIAMDLEALVEGLGHNVSGVARTRTEAVKLASQHRPGLILADIQLADGSSGIDAVNDLLKSFQVPVIFITAYPERFLTADNRPEPAFLIAKPYQPSKVSAVISQALFFQQRASVRS